MEKKKYTNPSITVVEMRGDDLLDSMLSDSGYVIKTNGTINKGNASTAAGKNHFNLWDYDEEDIEDFEDKEDEKRCAKH